MVLSISSASPIEENIIITILNLKGVEFKLLSPGNDTEIIDNKNCIRGMNIILEYLDERYPQNPLLPPDTITKAQVRMLSYSLLNKTKDVELGFYVNREYAEYYKDAVFLFRDDGPSIIDALIYAINPPGQVWKAMRAAIAEISDDAAATYNNNSNNYLCPVNTGAMN